MVYSVISPEVLKGFFQRGQTFEYSIVVAMLTDFHVLK